MDCTASWSLALVMFTRLYTFFMLAGCSHTDPLKTLQCLELRLLNRLHSNKEWRCTPRPCPTGPGDRWREHRDRSREVNGVFVRLTEERGETDGEEDERVQWTDEYRYVLSKVHSALGLYRQHMYGHTFTLWVRQKEEGSSMLEETGKWKQNRSLTVEQSVEQQSS